MPNLKPEEKTLLVSGVKVQTWTGGNGPPLLVLHGTGGNQGWLDWMDRVSTRFTVWAPTHPGFGGSDDAPWIGTVADLARFYLQFMDVAGLVRPDIVGHSLGGWIAAEMATMNPSSLGRMMLVTPAGLKMPPDHILNIFQCDPADLRAATYLDPSAVPEWNRLFGAGRPPAMDEIAVRNRKTAARLVGEPYLHSPALPYFLPQIANNVLIVAGRNDGIVPIECCEQYLQLLPNASLTVLDHCAHCPPLEQPARFANLVIDFLNQPSSSSHQGNTHESSKAI